MAGIYIHIPFCRQACTYCNFHFSTSLKLKQEFLQALAIEIGRSLAYDGNEQIQTVYFGGGTPSLLAGKELGDILENLRKRFNIHPGAEITLEANPDDISPAVLEQWLQLGINRLSLGVQSFSDQELKWMNRAHDASRSRQSIREIIEAGFTNFSADLIYGSPVSSADVLKMNTDYLFENKVPHISAYALTVEPKTALFNHIQRNMAPPVDNDEQARQFELLVNLALNAGFEHYEISNFAQPGYRSRHNTAYWQGKPYYGFGPAAHSYNGFDRRRWNVSNNALYIQSLQKEMIPFEEEILTATQQLNERIMIALRTSEGLNLGEISKNFGNKVAAYIKAQSEKFISEGLLELKENSLVLTAQGKFLADGISADLFAEDQIN